MISLERFNKQNHKYIYSIRWCSGVDCGYAVSGWIGTKFYMMYPLKEVIKLYNAAAKNKDKELKESITILNRGGYTRT